MDQLNSLADQLLALDRSLTAHRLPHAFGGAIALAYALEEPRATRDLDVNIFCETSEVRRVFAGLPAGIAHTDADRELVERDAQVRLWWDATPIDLFFDASPFHHRVGQRTREVPFGDGQIAVLDPVDLAVFKVLFDRTKDWLDLTMMHESHTLDVDLVARELVALVGADDSRIARLRAIPAG